MNALTVDVEDYYHVSGFESQIDRSEWPTHSSRVVDNTHRLLELLARHEARATFFVLGWVAREHPELVSRIHNAGHRIGSHGFWHRLIYRQKPEDFRRDIIESKDVLESILGEPVTAYRAPSFSITRESLWALDILAEEGFRYDSSIFPIRHDRYGIPGSDPTIHTISTAAGPLHEFPATVVRMGRWHLPVSGGGYFRALPIRWSTRLLRRVNVKERRPFVFYIHPWELDPDQPRLTAGSRLGRMRHYLNLSKTAGKLEVLLEAFRFAPLEEVVDEVL